MKTIIDLGLGTLVLGFVLLFAVSLFALPPMLMWVDQADKTMVMAGAVLVGLLFAGLLTLRFVLSGKSTLSTFLRTGLVVLGGFFVLTQIMPSMPDMFGGLGHIS